MQREATARADVDSPLLGPTSGVYIAIATLTCLRVASPSTTPNWSNGVGVLILCSAYQQSRIALSRSELEDYAQVTLHVRYLKITGVAQA